MTDPKMLDKIASGKGFIAALDQSGGSTPKALKGYGISEDAYSGDAEMLARRFTDWYCDVSRAYIDNHGK